MIKTREIMNRHTLKYSNVALLVLVILLGLIGGRLLLYWQEYKVLSNELSQLDNQTLQTSALEVTKDTPQTSQLLEVIDQCVIIFIEEDLGIRSYNLERIIEEGDGQTALHSALIRFKVRGSWAGIESGLQRIENLPQQGIHVEEAFLEKGGGEILLKIFFYEPDKLS